MIGAQRELDFAHPDEPWLAPRVLPWLLLALVVGALVLRVLWIWRYGHVIENQGVAYARVAEALAAGEGYRGILGDRYTLQGPLFPYLIVLFAPVAGSIEMAARWISCAAGVALIWPVYSITTTLTQRHRAGVVAAGLTAGNGVAAGFSAATYGEALFFFLLFAATALLIRTAVRADTRAALVAGVSYGLAYLVRPEALAYVALGAAFIVGYDLAKRQPWQRGALRAALLIGAFAVVIVPYAAWLSANSGYFRIEGKADYNALVNAGMADGMTFQEAARSIDTNMQPVGADMFANQFDLPRAIGGVLRVAQTIFEEPVTRGFRAVAAWAGDPSSGGELLAALAAIGMLAVFLGVREKIVGALFLCMTGGYVALILSVRFFDWARYVYPLTFFALVWAGAGISAIATACAQLATVLGGSRRTHNYLKVATLLVLMIPVSLISLSARYAPIFQESHMPWAQALKTAGLWMRDQNIARPLIMGANAVVPYYAHGVLAYLPWAPEQDALAYVHGRKPNFVVLRSTETDAAPYVKSWLETGIPDDCAEEVKRIAESGSAELVVYRWMCNHAL